MSLNDPAWKAKHWDTHCESDEHAAASKLAAAKQSLDEALTSEQQAHELAASSVTAARMKIKQVPLVAEVGEAHLKFKGKFTLHKDKMAPAAKPSPWLPAPGSSVFGSEMMFSPSPACVAVEIAPLDALGAPLAHPGPRWASKLALRMEALYPAAQTLDDHSPSMWVSPPSPRYRVRLAHGSSDIENFCDIYAFGGADLDGFGLRVDVFFEAKMMASAGLGSWGNLGSYPFTRARIGCVRPWCWEGEQIYEAVKTHLHNWVCRIEGVKELPQDAVMSDPNLASWNCSVWPPSWE